MIRNLKIRLCFWLLRDLKPTLSYWMKEGDSLLERDPPVVDVVSLDVMGRNHGWFHDLYRSPRAKEQR